MTLTSINEAFMLHRSGCPVCRSNGPALCSEGLGLIETFHQVIVEAAMQELHEMQRATA